MSDSKKKELLRFAPTNNWRAEDQRLYDKGHQVKLYNHGIKCYVGCNGAGKSTLLEQIESKLKQKGFIEVKSHKNPFRSILSDNDDFKGYMLHFTSDFEINDDLNNFFIDHYMLTARSTGETLFARFGSAAKFIGEYARKAKEMNVPLVIMWDDCDVGTSIDVQDEIVEFVKFIKKELSKLGINYSIVLTANSYELCKSFKCYDCTTSKRVTFCDYDAYKNFVLSTRKKKDARDNIHS